MSVRVNIPTPLRMFTGGKEAVEVRATTIGELLVNLTTEHRDLRRHLFSEDGKLRTFVNVYLNENDVRSLKREQTPLRDGDTVSIVPSVAGGVPSRHR